MDRQTGHLPTDVKKIVNNIVWVKVIALGNAGVGKTCLIKHFCESKFSQCYHATVGVDYGFKVQTVKNIPLRIHLWDLSGDTQYYDVRTELYQGADACFLVYDVTNPSSFEKLESWVKELRKHGAVSSKVVVVGNKADLRNNKLDQGPNHSPGLNPVGKTLFNFHFLPMQHFITTFRHQLKSDLFTKTTPIEGMDSIAAIEGRKWATAHKFPYYETSALTGSGVSKMFEDMLTLITEKSVK